MSAEKTLGELFLEAWDGLDVDGTSAVVVEDDDEETDEYCPECERSEGPHYRGPCEHGEEA